MITTIERLTKPTLKGLFTGASALLIITLFKANLTGKEKLPNYGIK